MPRLIRKPRHQLEPATLNEQLPLQVIKKAKIVIVFNEIWQVKNYNDHRIKHV